MIEILTIGDELTSGRTLDTNAFYLAGVLQDHGLPVARITTVGDALSDIRPALQNPLPATRFVLVTGGLGPTEDDRTARAAAGAFGRPLEESGEALALMEKRFRAFSRSISPANRKQALLPAGARVIENPAGTACGFLIREAGREHLFFPGVPAELRAMTDSFILEYLGRSIGRRQVIRARTLKVFGLWESTLQERLQDILPGGDSLSIGFYPHFPEISLKITGRGAEAGPVDQELDALQKRIYDRIGEYIYADSDQLLEQVVGALLSARGQTVAVAESCTGGLITHRLTDIPGSSGYLERSVVVYSNRAKQELLNVAPDLLERHGAVSEAVARSMAEGVRALAGTTYGLAVTGIAGPGGATAEKPVGTVFIALAAPQGTAAAGHRFHGSRDKIKMISAHTALNLLRKAVLKSSAA